MNNILTLYDIEFKKVKKIYFSILGLLAFSNLIVIIYKLYKVLKEVEKTLNLSGGISLLRHSESLNIFQSGNVIFEIYSTTFIVMSLSIIWCLYYAFYIWYRDFSGKTKSIYTLFMLPNNKFSVYISKLIAVISLIYGIVILQYLLWIIEINIIKGFTGLSTNYMIDIINFNRGASDIFGASIYPMEFVVLYLLTPILFVTIIFTAIMIHKSLNKIGAIVGITYVVLIVITFLYSYTYDCMYSDETLIFVLGFYAIAFLISMAISYVLINKKVYI